MDGESHRSLSGQTMFSESNSKTPFCKLRFDVESLISPLGSGGGVARTEGENMRFGMPADPLLDHVLQYAPAMPCGYIGRLHSLVDDLPEDAAV
jgi:hypothetical protein